MTQLSIILSLVKHWMICQMLLLITRDKGSICAPAVGKSSTASQKDVEMIAVNKNSDIPGHKTIDVDVIDTGPESDAHSNEFAHSDLELG